MQENKIKQRVVGGVVLLALAVIFIPMVLDFRKDYDQVINGTNIPPKPKDFRVETFALNDEPQIKVPKLSTKGAVEKQLEQHELVQQKRAAVPSAVTPPKPAPTQPKPVPTPPKPVKEADPVKSQRVVSQAGWTVQVGSFGSENNALRLRNKIRKRGYAAFVDTADVKGKASHRVRVGPEVERGKAEALQKALQKQMGLKGLVIMQE